MRIAFVNLYYPPDLSPTSLLTASLAEHHASLGDEVTVVTSAARYVGASLPVDTPGELSNVKVIRTSAPRQQASSIMARVWQYSWFYVAASWKLLRMPPQDAIVSLTTPPYIAWSAVLHRWIRARHCKIILWSMDVYPDILEASKLIRPNGFVAGVLRFVNRRLFRRIDHVVGLDEAMLSRLRDYAPDKLPMTVIPNWESTSLLQRLAEASRWEMLDKFDVDDQLVVLYLGNAGYGHEFETVLDAADKLRDEPIVFLFVGGGSKHAEIKRAAEERSLSKILLHDYVPESLRPLVLAAGDLALITLDRESLGLMCPSKLHAYLAAGLPVIYVGPQGSNVDQAIDEFECGIRIPNNDADALVNFVRTMQQDHHARQNLGENAKRAFDQAYCEQTTRPQFEALIKNCVECVR